MRDKVSRRLILDLKRAVFNARPPRSGDFGRALDALAGDQVLATALRAWEPCVRQRMALQEQGEAALRLDLAEAARRLAELWTRPELQTGILFAQPELFDRLDLYSQRSRELPGKLAETLARYSYRMGTKTSPFSTFTTTAVIGAPANGARDRATRGFVSSFVVNPRVVHGLAARMEGDADIGSELPLVLNDTVETVGDEVVFLSATAADDRRSAERLVWIQRTPLVEVVIELLGQEPGRLIRSSLVERIAPEAADPEVRRRLAEAIDDMIAVGFLRRSLDYDAAAPDALAQLAGSAWLDSTRTGVAVRRSLRETVSSLEGLADQHPRLQRRTLRRVRDSLREVFDDLGGGMPGIPEKGLVHHDVLEQGAPDCDIEALREVTDALSAVHAMLPLFNTEYAYRQRVQKCALEGTARNGSSETAMSLYRRFCARVAEGRETTESEHAQARGAVWTRMRDEAAGLRDAGEAELSAEAMDAFAGLARPYRIPGAPASVGYFGQLWRDGGGAPRFAINRLVPGNGVVVARVAADEGPPARVWLGDALREARRQTAGDTEVVDLSGTFGFGGQVGPRLAARRLAHPSEAVRLDGSSIAWSDVDVQLDPAHGSARLKDRHTGRWLVPIATGTMAPGLVPPFFRFAMSFGPAYFPELPLVSLFELGSAKAPGEVRRYPRLTHRGVVLLRRTWRVPRASVPRETSGGGSGFTDFRELRAWARAMELPTRVFVTPVQAGDAATGEVSLEVFRRLHKPFFVDWDDVLSHRMFRRLTREASATLTLTEMLPDPSPLGERDPDCPRVTEHYLELTEHS